MLLSSFEDKVFCVVTSCIVVVGYKCFRGPRCLSLHPEDGDSIQVEVFWFMTPRSVVVGCQSFRSNETLVS